MTSLPAVPIPPVSPGPGPRPRRESQMASRAFALYCAQGVRNRSYAKVLAHLVAEGLMSAGSGTTVERWGSQHHWQERVKAYDSAKIEEARPEWDSERLLRAKLRADAAGEGYEQAVKLLLERIQSGKLIPSDALVAAIKVFADTEHRDMDLVVGQREDKAKVAIQINVGLDTPDGPTETQSLTFGAQPQPLPDPDPEVE